MRLTFRAWQKEKQTMFLVTHMQWDDFGNITHVTRFTNKIDLDDCSVDKLQIPTNEVKDCVLMQSTGFHDVNGQEIFENDILYKIFPYGAETIEIHRDENHQLIAEYLYIAGFGKDDLANLGLDEWIIAGNRWQNPKLLAEEPEDYD